MNWWAPSASKLPESTRTKFPLCFALFLFSVISESFSSSSFVLGRFSGGWYKPPSRRLLSPHSSKEAGLRWSNVLGNCTDFRRPYRAMVPRDLTQAKARAMLSWPFGPQNHRRCSGCPNGLADGPKGQENSAQALAWVNIKRRLAL